MCTRHISHLVVCERQLESRGGGPQKILPKKCFYGNFSPGQCGKISLRLHFMSFFIPLERGSVFCTENRLTFANRGENRNQISTRGHFLSFSLLSKARIDRFVLKIHWNLPKMARNWIKLVSMGSFCPSSSPWKQEFDFISKSLLKSATSLPKTARSEL